MGGKKRKAFILSCFLLCSFAVLTAQSQNLPQGTIVIQGEDFAAEGGGKVEFVERGGAQTFRMWDYPGHWLEWKFSTPEAKRWKIAIRYAAATVPRRDLLINEEYPVINFMNIAFLNTGDWSNMQLVYLADEQGAPLTVWLDQGEHQLKMHNLAGGGMNVDYIALIPESEALSEGILAVPTSSVLKLSLLSRRGAACDEEDGAVKIELPQGEREGIGKAAIWFVKVNPEAQYSVSGKVKLEDPEPLPEVELVIRFFSDRDFRKVLPNRLVMPILPTSDWTDVTQLVSPPADAKYMSIEWQAKGVDNCVWLSHLKYERN